MPNRLENESSPYLLQHANNPVDWYPWGAEALARSRDEDKPIFLSIGYSACHWCHVMEHESFEDESIARVLNDNFINIKVDREERPDLDQIYMNAVMALRGGGGGWPLSVFLTPDQEVFFGGTYWPPRSRMNMPGFDHVLHSVLDAFTSKRDAITEQSKQITQYLNKKDEDASEKRPNKNLIYRAVQQLDSSFDDQNGGFGGAPKFPHSMDLMLLARLATHPSDDDASAPDALLKIVGMSLRKMAYGGIFDHLAGGFARYSVDQYWLVPHFEKMLYDNALLVDTYAAMFRQTGDEFYAKIVRKTLDYLLNYMIDSKGGIYSTEDADSEGEEGKFYVWSKNEVLEIVGDADGPLFCELYNVTERGNFEGQNILNMTISYQEFADKHGLAKNDLRERMRVARNKLLEVRDKRIRPGLDDKILVSWNALGISAFANAYKAIGDNAFLDAAKNAATFLLENLKRSDGRLLHTWRHGVAKLDAYLDDYSYLIVALIDLYESDYDIKWLGHAVEFTEQMIQHFGGGESAGFYFTADDHEQLIARSKSFQDSSVPSGNAMAAMALLRLGRMTGNTKWTDTAEKTISAAIPLIVRAPLASGQMLIAMDSLLQPAKEIVIVVDTESDFQAASELLRQVHQPNWTFLIVNSKAKKEWPAFLQSVLDGKTANDGLPTLFVCTGTECQSPVVGLEAIASELGVAGGN